MSLRLVTPVASLTTVGAIVSSPVLLHPRVNKALIALVAKKFVIKSSAKVCPSPCGRVNDRARQCTLGLGSRRASDGDFARVWIMHSTGLYHIALSCFVGGCVYVSRRLLAMMHGSTAASHIWLLGCNHGETAEATALASGVRRQSRDIPRRELYSLPWRTSLHAKPTPRPYQAASTHVPHTACSDRRDRASASCGCARITRSPSAALRDALSRPRNGEHACEREARVPAARDMV